MPGFRFRFDIPARALRGIETEARRRLGPVVVQIGHEMIGHAQQLTEERLVNDRPQARRRTDGAHYIDSFKVGAPDLSGGRVRAVFYNDHHFAGGIENGSPDHAIDGPGAFPIETLKGGNYASTAPPYRAYGGTRPGVNHPGSEPTNIMRDTRQWAKEQTGQIQVRVRVHLGR